MKYIEIDKLKEAGEAVISEIMKWWKPSKGDIVQTFNGEKLLISSVEENYIFFANDTICKTWNFKKNILPLLTSQQLIDFINWRTECGIEKIEYGVADCYWVTIWFDDSYFMGQDIPRWYSQEISFCDKELMQALWKCVCEVATDSYYD